MLACTLSHSAGMTAIFLSKDSIGDGDNFSVGSLDFYKNKIKFQMYASLEACVFISFSP